LGGARDASCGQPATKYFERQLTVSWGRPAHLASRAEDVFWETMAASCVIACYPIPSWVILAHGEDGCAPPQGAVVLGLAGPASDALSVRPHSCSSTHSRSASGCRAAAAPRAHLQGPLPTCVTCQLATASLTLGEVQDRGQAGIDLPLLLPVVVLHAQGPWWKLGGSHEGFVRGQPVPVPGVGVTCKGASA
jgi:hypothetical protein